MKPEILDELSIIIWLTNDNTGGTIQSIAESENFKRQDKRHITILSGDTKAKLKEMLTKFSDEEKENILQEIKNLINSLNWEYTPIEREIYKISRTGSFDIPDIIESRESYICMVNMPDMEVFYDKLNQLLKTNFPTQVPHITLFTKGERENPKYYGIGICSMEDFENYDPMKVSST